MTAPLLSATTPVMVPVSRICADREEAKRIEHRAAKKGKERRWIRVRKERFPMHIFTSKEAIAWTAEKKQPY
jgi:hypothetical protein